MTLNELLTLDIGVVGEELGRGFRWWTRELADLTPSAWRRAGRNGRPVVDLSQPDAARLWRGDRFVTLADGASDRRRPADVAIAPGLVLQRVVTLPALGMDDLRRLVANDIDRLTPFHIDQVYFDLEVAAKTSVGDRQTVALAVIRRSDADACIERALRLGIAPRRLGIAGEAGALAFDFLPSMKAAGRGGRPDHAPLYWWSAVAACLAINVGLLVFKDSFDVASLKNIVELQQPSVALAFKLRERVETEAAARQTVLSRRQKGDPLPMLAALTRVLPPPQSLQRLEFNGRAVRAVGLRDARFDVLAALQASGALVRPRAAAVGETPTSDSEPGFDVVADVAEPGAR